MTRPCARGERRQPDLVTAVRTEPSLLNMPTRYDAAASLHSVERKQDVLRIGPNTTYDVAQTSIGGKPGKKPLPVFR